MVLPVDFSIHKIEELKKENALLKQELAKVRAKDRKVRKTTGERSNQNLVEKNSGESLQKNEELFVHIIEIANEGIWVCNMDAETILINKKIAELLGYSPDEMMGKSAYYFMDDEAIEIAKSNFEKRKQGHTGYFQQKYIRKDGSFLWASVAASPIHDEQGNMVATLGMITDITESKLNVNALRKSETQYRHLVESVNSIILRWNVNGILTYVNEYALHFFGYRKKEMTGKDVMMLVPKTDSSGRDLTSLANDVLENPGKYVQFENENILKNGERVWISWTNRAIVDENGKLLEVLAVGNDITKRKKAENDLKRSEEFFSTLFELLPVGVSLATIPNGAVHNVNQAWLDLTGYSRKEEVLGKTSLELGLMRDPKQRESLLNEFREKGFVKNAETTFFTKTGEQRVVSINIHAIQIKEQKFIISTNTDITERKKNRGKITEELLPRFFVLLYLYGFQTNR